MTFVRERISEENKQKFGYTSLGSPSYWIIDKERQVFLIHEHYGREDNLILFKFCNCIDGKFFLKTDAKDRSIEFAKEGGGGTSKWYDLYNFVLSGSSVDKKELISALIEAVDEFGRTRSGEREVDTEVKITFAGKEFTDLNLN